MISRSTPCSLRFLALLALACGPSAGLAADEPASLPLRKVVLFNSGVGFYQHTAPVVGNARVDLKFNVDDVNDLLKSMVLEDLGGGKISTVTYGSKDPITKTLKTFSIDLTDNPTLADLLSQVRGEKVEIDAPNQVSGVIVGIEKRSQKVGEQVLETDVLNLLTDDGLRSVQLDTVGRIKLSRPELDAELRQALTVLALGHATDKKTVTLNFLGEGERPVRVGYIQESPIWKTSYRLVLKDDEPPFLQGWAIVENTTEVDWQDVALTLVSGRPISFVMDLYQPLYVARPVVVPELFASLRPQTYDQDLAQAEQEFADRAEKAGDAQGRQLARSRRKAAQFGGGMGGGGLQAGASAALAPPSPAEPEMNLQQGVQSVAQAANVGELFQYVIDTPVTLPRQQSAMLPIVNGSVTGEKVSIYNPAVHAKHPLNGLKMTNATGLHLMQGPITVFDGGAYAGDARIEDLPPGTERLISYAMDLDTEVAPESKGGPEQLVSCKLSKGVLHTTHKYRRTQHYTVKNGGSKAKKVLVEYPVENGWTLTAPEKPEEKTRDQYRFVVAAEPGKPATLDVSEERVDFQQVAVANLDDNTIRYYLQAKVVGEKVKAALADVIKRKADLAKLAAEKQQLEQRIATIDQEQARIRQNMAQLEKNTDLYTRYVKKFGEQEDQVEKLRKQIETLAADETQQRQSLDEYLLGLELE